MSDIYNRRVSGGVLISEFDYTLRGLLNSFHESDSFGKTIIMARLREYVKNTPERTLIREIDPIHDSKELNILLGVGLRGTLYYMVILKKAEMGHI